MLVGTADAEARAAGAPTMPALDTKAVTLTDVDVLQIVCEIKSAVACDLLPPALHPTVPGVISWLVYRCPESPWGPFSLAQSRIECRSGTRPRGLLLSGVIDNAAAAGALTERWGFTLQTGEIDLRIGYDGIDAVVFQDDRAILELGLRDPVLLPPDVMQFVSSLHPAHTPRGYRLVQIDPVHALGRAERGDPSVDRFDAAAWGDERIEPHYVISGAIGRGDMTLPKLRFLCRPGEIAFTGTETI